MQVFIRDAVSDDARQITEIYLESRKTFLSYATLTRSDREVGQWVAEELILGEVTVAGVGGVVVGFLATSRKDGVSWIDHLYLSPESVGRGVGARLLRHAMSSLSPPIRLYTFQQNSGGRRFYERFGFRLVALGDGSDNEEGCPDALYEFTSDGDRL